MTFSSIVRKNLFYNIKKYVSLYFVNTLIVAILFMFGSLLYNSDIMRQVGETTLYEIVSLALIGVVLFSIVFITYSNVSFLKYRGKEFGMYMTFGMTTKNIIKMLFLENVVIVAISLVSGLILGGVFGNLFYMGLNQILHENPIGFELNGQSLLLSSGIFLVIFGCNFIFNMLYIRKISISEVFQASSKKGIGKSSIVLGIVASILFTVSAILLPKILLGGLFNGNSNVVGILVTLTFVCPYVIIGTLIVVIKAVLKRFKRTYNNNLIVMSNLSHRFISYKTTLYLVTLLIAGALFFIGMTYSMYATSKDENDRETPFDVMFVETNHFNQLDDHEVENLLIGKGITLNQNSTLEFVEIPEFRDYKGNWVLWDTVSMIISKSHFNGYMGTKVDLSPNQALFVRTYEEKQKFEMPDTILPVMSSDQIEDKLWNHMSKEELLQALDGYPITEYKSENISEANEPFINYVRTAGKYFGQALVVDDTVYEQIKSGVSEEQVKKVHLLKGNFNEEGFHTLVNALQERNGLDSSYWNNYTQSAVDSVDVERGELEDLKPVYKVELLEGKLESKGTIFFIMLFLGALFVIASGVVLFHKVLSDIDEQKESMLSLKRIGVTSVELKKIVSKELAIVFFLPTVLGLGLGLYYFYTVFSNQTIILQLLGQAGLVALLFLVLQIAFYFSSRRKYFSELGKYL
ncbi:FtsX-like permease family protein [Paenibacillus segetis]|uniref:ABC transporter permease YvcS n=1 Tax=Paenibacillus segetis TaxID=1325360 RepID=A0ABQ1YGI0_9BACL|nr:FtsX-like permease family protein [Paenibacillus segetis]GGH23588.1 putative ABC transporter permease YvcS [Paenibacillus segetis]